jgi:hypothetical protein
MVPAIVVRQSRPWLAALLSMLLAGLVATGYRALSVEAGPRVVFGEPELEPTVRAPRAVVATGEPPRDVPAAESAEFARALARARARRDQNYADQRANMRVRAACDGIRRVNLNPACINNPLGCR